MNNRVLVLIPAFNEEGNIGQVVSSTRRALPSAHVLVVNDGSNDRTGQAAGTAGACVINLPFNLGIGGAVQTGYKFAAEKGYDVVIRLDGDGQHNPVFATRLLEPLAANVADAVVGSRYIEREGFQSSWLRRVGVRLFSLLVSKATLQKVTDPTSGFFAANRNVIAYLAKHCAQDYPEVEAGVDLRRIGFRVCEVAICMDNRKGGKSSIGILRSFYYVVKVSLAVLIGLLRRPPGWMGAND